MTVEMVASWIVAASTPFWAVAGARLGLNKKRAAQLAVVYDCIGVVFISSAVSPDWAPFTMLGNAAVHAAALVVAILVLRRVAKSRGESSLFDRPL